MKTKLVTLMCALTIGFAGITTCPANTGDAAAAVTDVVLVRPLGFVATLLGGVFYVISLPVTITSGSEKKAADTLVGKPARFTFQREIGDFDDLED